MRPYHARQLSSPQLKPALNAYHGKIEVYRIGDKMSEALKDVRKYSNIIAERKFCTLPELEILLIIAEGRFNDYQKVKSKQKPKDFCKSNILFNHKRYDNTTKFYDDYFSSRIDFLVDAIKQYRHLNGSHKKDEGYLADLLK